MSCQACFCCTVAAIFCCYVSQLSECVKFDKHKNHTKKADENINLVNTFITLGFKPRLVHQRRGGELQRQQKLAGEYKMNINIEVYQLKQNVVMDEQNKASFYIYSFPFPA